MHIKHTLVFLAFAAALVAPAHAQSLTLMPNTGCLDGSAEGDEIVAIDNELPTIGNANFQLGHTCEFGSTGAFFIIGSCNPPVISWPLSHPCFSGWMAPPATCNFGYNVFFELGGRDVRQDGKVIMDLPVPNDPGLSGQSFCLQFICVDLPGGRCMGISRGLRIDL